MTATDTLHRTAPALALLLSVSLAWSPVRAQATAANARAAQLLFDEAKRLADQKDFTAACPKFVQSHQLDPAGGTILHAADCHEHERKLASAWAEYNEALSYAIKANRADREAIARARIVVLGPKLAKLQVRLPPRAKSLTGFGIWLDGTRIGAGSLAEAPIPVDAGSHLVEARADGHLSASQQFVIVDGREQTIAFEELALDPAAKTDAAKEATAPVPQSDPSRGRAQRVAGGALLGAGGVGLALGTIFGIRALAIGDQADRCTLGSRGTGCPQAAVDDQSAARSSGTVSTIGFLVGGVLAAGGAILYFTAPTSTQTRGVLRAPRVALGGLSLSVSGEF